MKMPILHFRDPQSLHAAISSQENFLGWVVQTFYVSDFMDSYFYHLMILWKGINVYNIDTLNVI